MITRYITAILRDQFNLFFRFGFTDIPSVLISKTDKEIDQSIITLFSKVTPFYDESHYIILEFETTKDLSVEPIIRIEIQELVKIYPLSKLAFATIKQSRLDERIKIEEPIFEHILFDIELTFRRNNLLRSINALWKICDIDNSPNELFNKIGIENILKGIEFRKKGVKANMIKEGSYWSYLIAYDSYNLNFPSSTLGHFYDAGEVFAYSKNQETFVGSQYYQFLEKLNSKNPNLTLQEIINELEEGVEISAYRNKTTNDGLKQYLIAPIFLLLKEDLRKENELSKTKLSKTPYLLKVGGENFKAALVILGAFFGYDKFYDTYYDKLNLRFFKAHKNIKAPKKSDIKKSGNIITSAIKEKIDEDIPKVNVPTIEIKSDDKVIITQSVIEYQQVILAVLKSKSESSLSDLANEIKVKTGKPKFDNTIMKNIIKEMQDIEIFKDKQTEKARLKKTVLFDMTTES